MPGLAQQEAFQNDAREKSTNHSKKPKISQIVSGSTPRELTQRLDDHRRNLRHTEREESDLAALLSLFFATRFPQP